MLLILCFISVYPTTIEKLNGVIFAAIKNELRCHEVYFHVHFNVLLIIWANGEVLDVLKSVSKHNELNYLSAVGKPSLF